MKRTVIKFGGSSVETIEKMKFVANRIIERHKSGEELVVVVSAMGKTTNNLFAIARSITDNPSKRDLDILLSTGELTSIALLSIIINSLDVKSVALSAYQAKILTQGPYTSSKIINIETKRIEQHLKEGKVVIVAGYQGINEDGDITTLGREGSDTTAVALAYYLKCPCEIYTDVDGVYLVDPKRFKNPPKHEELCYHDMLLLSIHGAKVVATSAIEMASRNNIPLYVASTYGDNIGTYLKNNLDICCKPLAGIGVLDDIVVLNVKVPLSLEQIKKLYDLNIRVDIISFNVIALASDDLKMVNDAIIEVLNETEYTKEFSEIELSKISIIGKLLENDELIKDLKEYLEFREIKIVLNKHINNRFSILINKQHVNKCINYIISYLSDGGIT